MSRFSLGGSLAVPDQAKGVIVLAYPGRRERSLTTSRQLADLLHHAGLATLLLELMTPEEVGMDAHTGHFSADVERLAGRIAAGLQWVSSSRRLRGLPLGCLGDGPAAAASLVATAHVPEIGMVVGRGGRPDDAGAALGAVRAPALLIAGEHENGAVDAARAASARMPASEIAILDQVGDPLADEDAFHTVCWLTRSWFLRHLEEGH